MVILAALPALAMGPGRKSASKAAPGAGQVPAAVSADPAPAPEAGAAATSTDESSDTHSILLPVKTAGSGGSAQLLVDHGAAVNRINLLFLSEGYRPEEEAQFYSDARKKAEQLFTLEPYREYANFFNIYVQFVPSRDSGISELDQKPPIRKDTAFGAAFPGVAQGRLVQASAAGSARAVDIAKRSLPQASVILLIANSPRYGGGGGTPAVVTTDPIATEVIQHEFAHTLAGLADEYDLENTASDDYAKLIEDYNKKYGMNVKLPEYPNVGQESEPSRIKWRAWITPGIEVPTPDDVNHHDVVGAFEGSNYHKKGWFRPKWDCAMRTMGMPFCEVCREALVKSFYRKVNPVDIATVQKPISARTVDSVTLTAKAIPLASHSLRKIWKIDGIEMKSSSDSEFRIAAGSLSRGAHEVELQVSDPTSWVRSDPERLLQRRLSWTIYVN